MPVRNCCLGCQGNLCGPCGGCPAGRCDGCVGPWCVHTRGANCRSPCGDCPGVIHGARGGTAGSFFSCGHGCIGGCTGGVGCSCCGPACG